MERTKRLVVLGCVAFVMFLWTCSTRADTEPCNHGSPPPPTVTAELLDHPLCIADPAVIDTPLQVQLNISGLDPAGASEQLIRAADIYLRYTDETCGENAAVFSFNGMEPGGPGEPDQVPNSDESPFQEEVASNQIDPIIGGDPGLVAYAVGIALGEAQSACDNVLATVMFTPNAEGVLTIWFRDPAILPHTMLASDDGSAIESPDLVLAQPDQANALVITIDFTVPVISCPPDVALAVGDSIDPADTGQATALDNCDDAPLVTYEDDEVTCCIGNSVITRTWTAIDSCGNTSQCDQTLTVGDCASCQNEEEPEEEPGDVPDDLPPAEDPVPDPIPNDGMEPISLECCCGEGLCGINLCGLCLFEMIPYTLLGLWLMKRRMARPRH